MKLGIVAIAVALIAFPVPGKAAFADSFASQGTDARYTLNTGQTRVIDIYGTCRVVTNNSSRAVYIPDTFSSEWNGPNGFANNPPSGSGVITAPCYRCTVNYPQSTTVTQSYVTSTPGTCTNVLVSTSWYRYGVGSGTYAGGPNGYCGWYFICTENYQEECTPTTYQTNYYNVTTTNYNPIFVTPAHYDNLSVTMVGGGGGGGGNYNLNIYAVTGCYYYFPYAGGNGSAGSPSYFATSSIATYAAGGGGGCGTGAGSGVCAHPSPSSYGPTGTDKDGILYGIVNPLSTSISSNAGGAGGGYGSGMMVWSPDGCGPLEEYGQASAGAAGDVVTHVYNSDDPDLANAVAGPSPGFESNISIAISPSGGTGGGSYNANGGNGNGGWGSVSYSTDASDGQNSGASCSGNWEP